MALEISLVESDGSCDGTVSLIAWRAAACTTDLMSAGVNRIASVVNRSLSTAAVFLNPFMRGGDK